MNLEKLLARATGTPTVVDGVEVHPTLEERIEANKALLDGVYVWLVPDDDRAAQPTTILSKLLVLADPGKSS